MLVPFIFAQDNENIDLDDKPPDNINDEPSVDLNINIYDTPGFYDSLSDSDYSELDYTLVDFLMIPDHDNVDASKYFNDLGCYQCSLDRGDQYLVFFRDMIVHPNENLISIPGNYPDGTLFIADENGIEVILPNDVDFSEIIFEDEITINTNGLDMILGGAKVNGKVSYKGGDLYVKVDDKAIINDIEITALKYNDVSIFFDGTEHTGSYVSFGVDKLVVQGDYFDVNFIEDNNYVDVNPDEDDRFIMGVRNNCMVSISNPDETLAPEVIFKGPESEDEWAIMRNGVLDFKIGSSGNIMLDTSQTIDIDYGSVPMGIKILDEHEDSLITREDVGDGKIVIDNDNTLTYANINSFVDVNGDIFCSAEEIPDDNSISTSGMAGLYGIESKSLCWFDSVTYENNRKKPLIEQLQKEFGPGTVHWITFKGIEDWSYDEVKKMTDYLHKLLEVAPSLFKLLDTIEIVDNIDMDTFGSPDGQYCKATGTILISRIVFNFESNRAFGVLVHEMAHQYHFSLPVQQGKDFIEQWLEATDDGDSEAGKLQYQPIEWKLTRDEFVSWFYKGYLDEVGWVSAYSSKDKDEDVAEMTRVAVTKKISSKFYTNKHFRKKIYLLCEYGFLERNSEFCEIWRLDSPYRNSIPVGDLPHFGSNARRLNLISNDDGSYTSQYTHYKSGKPTNYIGKYYIREDGTIIYTGGSHPYGKIDYGQGRPFAPSMFLPPNANLERGWVVVDHLKDFVESLYMPPPIQKDGSYISNKHSGKYIINADESITYTGGIEYSTRNAIPPKMLPKGADINTGWIIVEEK